MPGAASSICRERAAELLDVVQTGTARVRVTYLGRADLNGAPPPSETPPEIANALPAAPAGKVDTAALGHRAGRAGGAAGPDRHAAAPRRCPAADRSPTNQPTGQVTKVPVPAVTHLYVQVGAFSKLDNAKTLADQAGRRLADFHPSTERPDSL